MGILLPRSQTDGDEGSDLGSSTDITLQTGGDEGSELGSSTDINLLEHLREREDAMRREERENARELKDVQALMAALGDEQPPGVPPVAEEEEEVSHGYQNSAALRRQAGEARGNLLEMMLADGCSTAEAIRDWDAIDGRGSSLAYNRPRVYISRLISAAFITLLPLKRPR
jgi:hypothetical protein